LLWWVIEELRMKNEDLFWKSQVAVNILFWWHAWVK